VLFYDLLQLITFKLRSVAAAAGGASSSSGSGSTNEQGWTEEAWEEVEATVRQLEAQLGPREQFVR
jgi:hypothetical protein